MHTSDPDCLTDAAVLPADQVALARHHAYSLFSRLFLHGVTADLFLYLDGVPELGRFVEEPYDLDMAAANFQHLFGFNLFPFESIFLDPTGLLGGSVTGAVAHFYQKSEFAIDENAGASDHFGHELGLLATLCNHEAAAWEVSLPLDATEYQRRQRDFLHSHLLRWVYPLVTAVQHQDNPFFSTLIDLTRALIEEHYTDLATSEGISQHSFQFPAAPPLLQLDQTSLKDIANFLATPVYSGIFLSRDVVEKMARQMRLPRGFGNRRQMLLNLMRSAVEYDLLDAMLESLRDLVGMWQQQYAGFVKSHPATAGFVTPWEQRSGETSQFLTQIREQIESISK